MYVRAHASPADWTDPTHGGGRLLGKPIGATECVGTSPSSIRITPAAIAATVHLMVPVVVPMSTIGTPGGIVRSMAATSGGTVKSTAGAAVKELVILVMAPL